MNNNSASGYARPFIFTGAGNFVAGGNVINGTGATNPTALTKEGGGTLTVSGANTYTGGTVLFGGTLALTNGAGLGTGGVTAVNNAVVGAGTLAFAGTTNTTLANVITSAITVIQTGASTTSLTGANTYTGSTIVNNAAGAIRVNGTSSSPVLTGAGADVQNGSLLFDYTGGTDPVTTIRSLLATGFGNGFTAGPLRSSTATMNRGLGYADDGTTTVTVKSVLNGDANLDGTVTIADFNALAGNFNQPVATYAGGDFNYDGQVTIADFNLLAANFNRSTDGGVAGPNFAAYTALFGFASANHDVAAFESATGVPEPAVAAVTILGAFGVLRRRRV